MLKLRFLILIFCLACANVFAGEEAVVSLFDGTPEAKGATPEQSQTKEQESGGLFSFLNFKLPDNWFGSDPKENPIDETIKLADQGNVDAQLFLGYSYLYGENGLPTDYEKSFEYYGKAALQNNAIGLNNLGSLYYGGIGVQRSSAKAGILFKKAAELGNLDAAVNLGFMHISGYGAKQDARLAIDYFEKASASENAAARFMTGYAYYKGVFRKKDYIKAAPLIKSAADLGFDEAQILIAEMYMNGYGFPQNYQSAVKYLKAAASQGRTDAMMILADILSSGQKYAQDIGFSHILYNLASVRGVAGAAEKRKALEAKMKIDVIIQAQNSAAGYVEQVSPITSYIHQTFGNNVTSYFK